MHISKKTPSLGVTTHSTCSVFRSCGKSLGKKPFSSHVLLILTLFRNWERRSPIRMNFKLWYHCTIVLPYAFDSD